MAYHDGEPICRVELIAGREAWGKVVAETKKTPVTCDTCLGPKPHSCHTATHFTLAQFGP